MYRGLELIVSGLNLTNEVLVFYTAARPNVLPGANFTTDILFRPTLQSDRTNRSKVLRIMRGRGRVPSRLHAIFRSAGVEWRELEMRALKTVRNCFCS